MEHRIYPAGVRRSVSSVRVVVLDLSWFSRTKDEGEDEDDAGGFMGRNFPVESSHYGE